MILENKVKEFYDFWFVDFGNICKEIIFILSFIEDNINLYWKEAIFMMKEQVITFVILITSPLLHNQSQFHIQIHLS